MFLRLICIICAISLAQECQVAEQCESGCCLQGQCYESVSACTEWYGKCLRRTRNPSLCWQDLGYGKEKSDL